MRADLWVRLGLVALVLAVYGRVINLEFVTLDDPTYVMVNQRVKEGINLANIQWAFLSGEQANWHPLTWISLMLDTSLFGFHPAGYHLTNLLLHAASTLVLYAAILRMTERRWPSALVAALFAVHPIHVESVAWITERKDTLSQFFGMCALWGYARYAKTERDAYYLLTGLFLVLSLLAKQTLVTFPFVLLLLDYWPLGRLKFGQSAAADAGKAPVDPMSPTSLATATESPAGETAPDPSPRRAPDTPLDLVLEKLPLLFIAIIFAVIVVKAQGQVGAVVSLDRLPLDQRITNAVVAYVTYGRRLFWPVDLAVFYARPLDGYPAATVASAGALLLAITVAAALLRRRAPYFLVGWLWFLGTLVPMIGLVQVGDQAMADRYAYFPFLGLYLAISFGLADLVGGARVLRAAAAAAALASIAVLSLLAFRQVGYWQDGRTLFTHALEVTQKNYFAEHAVATLLNKEGKTEEALAHMQRAIELAPKYQRARIDMAIMLSRLGRYAEAHQQLDAALELNPNSVDAFLAKAQAYTSEGKFAEAEEQYQKAIPEVPDLAELHSDRGRLLDKLGRRDEAIESLRRALDLNPGLTNASVSLARILLQAGRPVEALAVCQDGLRSGGEVPELTALAGRAMVEQGNATEGMRQLERAVAAAPDSADVQGTLAAAYAAMQQWDKAASHYELALKHNPANPRLRFEFGTLLGVLGRVREAEAMLLVAKENDPHDPRVRLGLGAIKSALGEPAAAKAEYEAALRLRPGWPDASNDLAWLLATSADPKVRDGKRAVDLAEFACKESDRKLPPFLDTLACAYAEAGRFDEAAKTAEEAAALLKSAGRADAARDIEARAELFRQKKPYRAGAVDKTPAKP